MKIEVKYKFSFEEPITVQTGFWEDGYFQMETCNHAGKTVEEATTFDGYDDGQFYKCDKCDETETIEEE